MTVALSLERLYPHGGYEDPTAAEGGVSSGQQQDAQDNMNQDVHGNKENDKQLANQDQDGDDRNDRRHRQQQDYPAGSYEDRRGGDQDKLNGEEDYRGDTSPSSQDGNYYSHYQQQPQQQQQQYAPPHPAMDRSQAPYLSSIPQHYQYNHMAPPPLQPPQQQTGNGYAPGQYQQQQKDLGNPAEEYVTDPLPFDYAGVPQAGNGSDKVDALQPTNFSDDSRFYSKPQQPQANTRAPQLSYNGGYSSPPPYNSQQNVGPTPDKNDDDKNQDDVISRGPTPAPPSGYYQNMYSNERSSYAPQAPPNGGDHNGYETQHEPQQFPTSSGTSGPMSMTNMQAFAHTYSPSSMVDTSSQMMSKKDSPSESYGTHSPPMEYNAINSRTIESQDAVIKVKTPLKSKYWRNGRRNLQCFPSCKVYGDYSAIKLEDLKQHDFMWGKCRGSIITEVTLTSNYAFQDILILGRVHSLESVPVAFEDAVIRECMIGRTVDCDGMDSMKENWITGEQLPTFVEQPPNVASYEFKPKVWKYMDDMAQGKCKRRNVRYYVQFEAFVLVMQGGQRCYLCIGSGMSTPFEVGSSRVLARQKRKAAANAEAAAASASVQQQQMPPHPSAEMSMASLHHSAMPMQQQTMPHGMLMPTHQMQPMPQSSLFNGNGYGGPGPSPMGQQFPPAHRGLPSSFPNPLHSMGPMHHPPFSLGGGQPDHLGGVNNGNNSVGEKRKLGDENTFATYLQPDRSKLLKSVHSTTM